MLASVTLVAVVDAAPPDAAMLARFAAALTACCPDVETVLVVGRAPTRPTVLALKALAAEAPDLTVVLLAEPVHDDTARLVGIEHAVGDAVIFADLLHTDPADLPPLLAPLAAGYDLVVADRGTPARRFSFFYAALFRLLTGAAPDLRPTGLRALSRAAALHVAARPDAELAVRARALGASFPSTVIRQPGRPEPPIQPRRHSLPEALGLLLSASTLPLRGASYAAALGGILSALYSVYVFAVFLLKRDVAAGWTTLSLQLSGMMFIFSVIQLYAGAPPRSRRHLVLRELRSPSSRRAGRLNVVDADGRFQLGAPAWLDK
jgi:hypothetical protein